MHDTLYCGKRFRTFNVLDEGARPWPSRSTARCQPSGSSVLDQLAKAVRFAPDPRRQRSRTHFGQLVAWCERHGVLLHHIQPGKPTQNAYIERFNRTFRNEVLDAHLFDSSPKCRDGP
ncbi:MAG: transposase [Akkermansiaceae bacterium]|nr:transposase [Akkermansiaceae bacterium]